MPARFNSADCCPALSPSNGIKFYRYAYLVDGKVMELRGSPPGRCVMQADRSMQCDIAYILQPS